MEIDNEESLFKVPNLSFGPKPGTKKPVKSVDIKGLSDSDDIPVTINSTEDSKNCVGGKIEQLNKTVKKTSLVPIPYEEPSWGGKPGDKYFLEV